MHYLKQSTATTLKIGPFLDDTDGKTAETGLTIAQADVRLSKNGGDIAQKTESTSCTHDELGVYGCPIDATDTNTLGRLQLWVHESGALPVFVDYMVVTANFYDSLFSTDKLQVDVTQIGGVAQSATDLKDFADTGYDPATHRTQAQIKGTDDIDLSATQKTSVNTEADTALSDIKLDHLINIAVDTNWATTVHLDSVIGHLADVGTAATFSRTTDALEALRNRGDAAWIAATGFSTHSAADVKTAIEQAGSSIATILADTGELQTDWVNGGRLDLILDIIAADTTTDIPALINALENISAADVNAQCADVWRVDTVAEMAQGAPPASPTPEQALNYIYRLFRNKTLTTATLLSIRNDADDATLCKSTVSDNGATFTKAEYVSGA